MGFHIDNLGPGDLLCMVSSDKAPRAHVGRRQGLGEVHRGAPRRGRQSTNIRKSLNVASKGLRRVGHLQQPWGPFHKKKQPWGPDVILRTRDPDT
jgi:hypothetical protein